MTELGTPRLDVAWSDLVRRCVAGDEQSWERLVESAWPTVYRWMLRACHDRDLAQDLSQTVFLRLLEDHGRRLRLYDPDRCASFATYLRAVASNLYVDWTRSREGLDRTRWYNIDVARNLTGSTPSPDERLTVSWILDCLDQLSPREAQALRLLLCGWSYEEIARDLNIGCGGAGALIYRGREHLRGLLQKSPEHACGRGAPVPAERCPPAPGGVAIP